MLKTQLTVLSLDNHQCEFQHQYQSNPKGVVPWSMALMEYSDLVFLSDSAKIQRGS